MSDDSRAERPWPDEPAGPDEPTEPDPEARWGDPESELVPPTPTPATREADVDPEILAAFWRSVVLANVAVAGLAVGPMVVYFRGLWVAGGASVAVGAFALVRVYQHVRAFREREHADGEVDADGDETDADGDETDADGDETDADGDETDADGDETGGGSDDAVADAAERATVGRNA